MTFSPLTARVVRTDKRSSRLGRTIERYIIHHTAGGDVDSNLRTLATGPAKKSANYLLPPDGRFIGLVDEEYRAWTSGSQAVDGNAVTVETINIGGAPDWPVSAEQLEAHAQMAADLSRRHGWGGVDRSRVRGHREFAATACPGPFLWRHFDDIIARANQILATTPPSLPSLGESEMLAIRVNRKHMFTVSHGIVTHWPGSISKHVQLVTNVLTTEDQWHELTLEQFNAVLLACGIPTTAADGARGVVRDSITDRVGPGLTWSRSDYALAQAKK